MARQNQFRIALLNAENLFLFMDRYQSQDLKSLTERDWQGLSRSTLPNKPILKVRWLAESLLEIDADMIMLNEVGGLESLENFNRYFLNDQYRPLLIEGNSDRGIDIGYLMRRSLPYRYLLNSHKRRPLNLRYPHEVADTEDGDSKAPHFFSRDVAELRIFHQDQTKPWLVCLLTHLKSKWDREGFDPEGRDRRRAEAEKLMEIYAELKQELGPQTHFLLAGDLNARARGPDREPELQSIFDSDLQDVFDCLEVPVENTATQYQFRRGQGRVALQIDHIFISPGLKPFLIASDCEVFRYRSDLKVPLPAPDNVDQRNVMPSDHYPVVASLIRPIPS